MALGRCFEFFRLSLFQYCSNLWFILDISKYVTLGGSCLTDFRFCKSLFSRVLNFLWLCFRRSCEQTFLNFKEMYLWQQHAVLRETSTPPKKWQQTFVLHTQKNNASLILRTQKSAPKSRPKKVSKKAARKVGKSWEKVGKKVYSWTCLAAVLKPV